jgi:3-hydroxyisobutyrate dehydrogenase-like beta-hydroxyacid dehydrogenase
MRVAFIGTGRMGRPMAANLAAAGHDVVLHNRTRSRSEAVAAEIGAAVADSPRQAAEGSEAVITMLPDVNALRTAYEGDEGALAALAPSSVAVDMGTTGPAGVAWLDGEVRRVGATLVDAPVSGSTATATDGALTIMAGGPADAFARVEPLLRAMGSRVYHLGATGSGAAMKLAVNAVIYALAQAISESLVLAERSGIERELAYDVFENSAVAAPMVKYRHEQFLRPEEAPVSFAVALAEKDLRLIDALATELGVPMAQARVNLDSYARAGAAGHAESDLAALAVYLRELAGGATPSA